MRYILVSNRHEKTGAAITHSLSPPHPHLDGVSAFESGLPLMIHNSNEWKNDERKNLNFAIYSYEYLELLFVTQIANAHFLIMYVFSKTKWTK